MGVEENIGYLTDTVETPVEIHLVMFSVSSFLNALQ